MIRVLLVLIFMFPSTALVHAEETKAINVSKHIKKCKACHGKDLKGKKKTSGIYGESFSVLYTSLTSDVPKKMEKIVKKFSKDEAMAIASYIAHFDEEPDDESERD